MRRIAIVLALALALGGLALAVVRVDTDARALLGADAATAAALDTAEGRALTVAIVHPDRALRTAIARETAAALRADPTVARVTLAPAPSEAEVDWLWQHRFALAPPPEAAFAPEALAAELRRARTALTDAAAAPFAGRYLLDPTGSFRRLVEGLAAPSDALPVHEGVPQARDDSAALLFVELAELPFDTEVQAAFDARLRAMAAAAGAEALLVGPRTISAATSREIAGRATVSTLAASTLLLLWLAAVLRSGKAILACLLPPALGAAAAALVVQVAFGSVHVLALGFGGALLGLALDYPLHLMAHPPGSPAAHARRCVRIGAATTALAFLSLVVSGIPAIAQVGVFVAAGLLAAAGAALWTGDCLPRISGGRSGFPSRVPAPRLRRKLSVLVTVGAFAALGVILLPTKGADRLAELPAQVRADIASLDRMLDLPSGRHRVEVSGASLTEVLDRQTRLAPVLERARADGRLARFDMLAAHLPERPENPALPAPERLSAPLADALAQAGLRPGFRAEIVEAYRQAVGGRDVRAADLSGLPLPAATGLIRAEGDVMRASAALWDVADPDALAEDVAALGDPAIRFVDRGAELVRGFDRLAARVRVSVAIGAGAALAFLLAAVRGGRAVAEIVAGCAAAALVTACLAGLIGGGLGVFHVMALALVIGIGIDYGLLLTLSGDDAQFGAAARSVLLCATTTLIAFIIMAFSGVGVLEDIGTTVVIGVLATLAASAVRSAPRGGAR